MQIQIKHIKKVFKDKEVLNDISFTIESGSICGLLGVNGAGKSTLIKVLGGIYTADEGEIIINGKKVNIDGVKEVFKSENEDAISDADETGYSLKLENDSYIIEISAKIGETNIESDSTMATGTLKITRKSDKATSTIEFEGGTAC